MVDVSAINVQYDHILRPGLFVKVASTSLNDYSSITDHVVLSPCTLSDVPRED